MASPLYEVDTPQRPQFKGWQIGSAFALLIVIYSVGFALGGEAAAFMTAGLQTLPFAVLAFLAYLGVDRLWARIAALLWAGLLVIGTGLLALGLSFQALVDTTTSGAESLFQLVDGGGMRLAALIIGSGLAFLIAALGFIPGVRRALSRVIPLEPDSFVHMVALITVTAIALLSFMPLIVLAAPPLLMLVEQASASGVDLTGGRGDAGMLRDLVYGLVWTIPATIVAVGYGVRRNLSATLTRLGLVRPTWRQALAALGLAVALVLLAQVLDLGITWLWDMLGWPRTNAEAFGELLAFAANPLGAVVIGITAGLGEELAVRGVLQPRLGILLSNLFFTSLHAFQYNWDALLVVFVVGVVLGLVRQRSNTTTAAIVHGTYNFLLVMAAVLSIPGMSG